MIPDFLVWIFIILVLFYALFIDDPNYLKYNNIEKQKRKICSQKNCPYLKVYETKPNYRGGIFTYGKCISYCSREKCLYDNNGEIIDENDPIILKKKYERELYLKREKLINKMKELDLDSDEDLKTVTTTRQKFSDIRYAIQHKKKMKIRYNAGGKQPIVTIINPIKLIKIGNKNILKAYCELSGEEISVKTSKIISEKILNNENSDINDNIK